MQARPNQASPWSRGDTAEKPEPALVKQAAGYLEAFEKLSALTQAHVSRSLKGQTGKLIDYIAAALDKLDDAQDDDFNLGLTPRP